jgi:hypothetical protein
METDTQQICAPGQSSPVLHVPTSHDSSEPENDEVLSLPSLVSPSLVSLLSGSLKVNESLSDPTVHPATPSNTVHVSPSGQPVVVQSDTPIAPQVLAHVSPVVQKPPHVPGSHALSVAPQHTSPVFGQIVSSSQAPTAHEPLGIVTVTPPPPQNGEPMTGFKQQSCPVSVEQSLSLVQVFAQVVAQTPSQQSSEACVSQSVSTAQVLAQSPAGSHTPSTAPASPAPFGSAVQHASPAWVSHWALSVHGVGQSSVAVQIACAKSVQHLGVRDGHWLSEAQVVTHSVVGAQTVAVEAWLIWQHDSPPPVLHWLSPVQKTGHSAGATQDDP